MERKDNNLKLPFNTHRSSDAGEWIYVHRVGLLATVAVYLLILIAFVSYKIIVKPIAMQQVQIEIVPDDVQTPKEELKQEQVQMERIAYEDVKVSNRVSDENSKLDASLRDRRHNNAEQIYDQAQRVQQELAQGQSEYEKGLAEIEAMHQLAKDNKDKNRENAQNDGKDKQRQRARVKGNVIISYNLENRTDIYLHIPAYLCQGGAEVIVNITVNRNGKVIAAAIAAASTTDDNCILDMALQSAKASSFNASANAPDKQRGSITYLFVAQ